MTTTADMMNPSVVMAIRSLEMRAKLVVDGFRTGLNKSPRHGFSVEFSEYRPYTQGDDPRFWTGSSTHARIAVTFDCLKMKRTCDATSRWISAVPCRLPLANTQNTTTPAQWRHHSHGCSIVRVTLWD